MIIWMFLVWAVTIGHPWQSQTNASATSAPRDVRVAPEKRMFAVPSRQTWDRIRQRLTELGFSADKTDRTNQIVLTKWREVGAKGTEWLPAPDLPQPYVGLRVRFEVFVSPFAEPARVYVSSVIRCRSTPQAWRDLP